MNAHEVICFIVMPNTELHVDKVGDGPRHLVFLHGWCRQGATLHALAELLSDIGTIHLVDLPGFGRSELPSEAWGTYEYAKRIKTYIDDQGIQHATVLGHSFGGRVSLQMAAHFPTLVENLILIGSHGLIRKRPPIEALRIWSIRQIVKVSKSIDRVFGTKIFANKIAPKFGSPDYNNAGPLKPVFLKVIQEDLTETAKKISARTLLLWGTDDTETPIEMARRFNQLIKNSVLIEMPGKGHEPYLGVGAHLCAQQIRKFLGG